MKKFIILFTSLVLFYKTGHSQSTSIQINELKVGDKLPPIVLSGFLHDADKKLAAAELYKNGLLIIDFWATWCVPCISELKKADTLTQRYRGRLNILSVAYEDKAIISSFLIKHPEINTSGIKVLTNDKVLSKYFPHRSLPHNIWIDSTGVIKAVTFSQEVTPENIDKALTGSGSGSGMYAKHDDLNFDYEKPYHVEDSAITYRSVFSRYNPGIAGGVTVDRGIYKDKRSVKRIFAWNGSITQLLWLGAFAKLPYQAFDENYKLIEIQTSDSSRLLQSVFVHSRETLSRYESILKWSMKNAYCYELILPEPVPDTTICSYVMQDLLRNLPVRAGIEPRQRISWVITSGSNLNKYRSAGRESAFRLSENALEIRNMTLTEILQKLNHYFPNLDPFIDETGAYFPIDLDLHSDKKGMNFEVIRQLLTESGFHFKSEKRTVNVLVINDEQTGNKADRQRISE